MDSKWQSSITISLSNDPTNLVAVQDLGNHDPLDASQNANCVLMDSEQGTKDPLQDSKCTELDSHVRQLLPMANYGHTNTGFVASVGPDPNSTPTAGNISQSICFSMDPMKITALQASRPWAMILYSLL